MTRHSLVCPTRQCSCGANQVPNIGIRDADGDSGDRLSIVFAWIDSNRLFQARKPMIACNSFERRFKNRNNIKTYVKYSLYCLVLLMRPRRFARGQIYEVLMHGSARAERFKFGPGSPGQIS